MPRPATKAIEHKQEFFCLTCEIPKPFGRAELKLHLEAFHDGTPLEGGRRVGLASVDMRDMYSHSWEWQLQNHVRVLETCTGPAPKHF